MATKERERDNDRRSRDEDGGFVYKRRSAEAARKRASERTGNFDSFIKSDFKRYKPRDGKNMIRVLPPTWEDPEHYAYTIFLNYGIGADNQTFLSLSEMKGEKDPLAEARKEAQRDGDKEMAKKLTPRKRSLMWIIDRMDEEEGPQLWDAPFTVDTDFLNLCIDEDTKEITYVDDPKSGHDIRFYKEGQGLNTKYPAARMKIMEPAPLSDDKGLQQEWLLFVKENPIPDCLQFYDYDHVSEAFDGVVASRDDDAEKDGKGGKKPRDDDERESRPARADRRPSREPDDDEESADEKPAKEAGRRARTQLREDDEGDDNKSGKGKNGDDREDNEADEDDGEKQERRPSIRERLQARRTGRSGDDD